MKMKWSEFLEELESFAGEVRADIEANCAEWDNGPTAVAERRKAVFDDLNGFKYFVQHYFPHYLRHAEPSQLHNYLFKRLPEILLDEEGQLDALAAPRGEAKSTIVTRLFSLYCICTAKKRFIVIVCDTLEQAAEFIEAIKIELETNPRLKIDFPEAFGTGSKWKVNKVVTKNNIKLQGAGSKQKLRGLIKGAFRPDLLIIDDLENDENVETLAQRNKVHKWLKKAALKLGAAGEKFDVLFIGTILHYDSVLNRTLKNNGWNGKIFKAIIRYPDNMKLWDEWEAIFKGYGKKDAKKFYRQNKKAMDKGAIVSWIARPLYDLMVIRVRDGHDEFASEYQNDPTDSENAIFNGSIHYWTELPNNLMMFGGVDPSLGKNSKKGDPSAIIVAGYDLSSGIFYIIEADIKRRAPDMIISDVIRYQAKYRCVLWAVESVQFQEFLRTELVKRARKQHAHVPAKPINNTSDKILRIQALQPHMSDSVILLHPDQSTLVDHFTHFPKHTHDDGPDAVEMAWKIATGFMQSAKHEAWNVPEPNMYDGFDGFGLAGFAGW